MSDIEKKVAALIDKAVESNKCDDAMRFTQAALNAAHAAQVLTIIERDKK